MNQQRREEGRSPSLGPLSKNSRSLMSARLVSRPPSNSKHVLGEGAWEAVMGEGGVIPVLWK